MKNAAMNIHLQGFVWTFLFIYIIYIWVELLCGNMVIMVLNFFVSPFSKVAASFYIPNCNI